MAGSNGFSITINAVDQASKQIDAVNRRIAAMQAAGGSRHEVAAQIR